VADGPTLGDPAVVEAVHRGEVPRESTCGRVDAHEAPALPPAACDAELHDDVALADDGHLVPRVFGELVPADRLEVLAGSSEPARPAGSKSVVDHVGRAERLEPGDVIGGDHLVELSKQLLVGRDAHGSASLP